MFRTVVAAIAAILATGLATQATAQPDKLVVPAAGRWAVVQIGDQRVSHCVMGVRSDTAAPVAGQPQFMISADDQFVILRVRAAEWSFTASRDIAVTLATGNGSERQPAAAVHGADLIDIAFGVEPERINELAASSYLDIRTEGTSVRLPLKGLAQMLPAYRDCLKSVGQPTGRTLHARVRLSDPRQYAANPGNIWPKGRRLKRRPYITYIVCGWGGPQRPLSPERKTHASHSYAVRGPGRVGGVRGGCR